MIQAIQSNMGNQVDIQSKNTLSLRTEQQDSVKKAAPSLNNETEQQAETGVTPAYTVEISEAAQLALQGKGDTEGSAPIALAAPSVTSQEPKPAGAPPTGISADLTSLAGEEDDTSVDSSNLTQYTTAQLAEFVSQGLLTQSEVNEELAKRQNEAGSDNTQSVSAAEKMME